MSDDIRLRHPEIPPDARWVLMPCSQELYQRLTTTGLEVSSFALEQDPSGDFHLGTFYEPPLKRDELRQLIQAMCYWLMEGIVNNEGVMGATRISADMKATLHKAQAYLLAIEPDTAETTEA